MRVSELIEQLESMNPDAYVATGIDVHGVTECESDPTDALSVATDKHGVVTIWGHMIEEQFEHVDKGDYEHLENEKNREIGDLEDEVERLEAVAAALSEQLAEMKAETVDRHAVS